MNYSEKAKDVLVKAKKISEVVGGSKESEKTSLQFWVTCGRDVLGKKAMFVPDVSTITCRMGDSGLSVTAIGVADIKKVCKESFPNEQKGEAILVGHVAVEDYVNASPENKQKFDEFYKMVNDDYSRLCPQNFLRSMLKRKLPGFFGESGDVKIRR